jgi:hypothetical protein
MKHNKLITMMALTLSLSLTSCSDDDKGSVATQNDVQKTVVSTQQSQSEIMSYIPADTPVLMLFANDEKHPLPQNLKDKMEKVYSSVGDIVKMTMEESINKNDNGGEGSAAMTALMDKWLSEEGISKLGLSMDENEFALYAVDLFPVLRMTLAKTHAMGEVLDELMGKANESKPDTASKREVNGSTVYQFGDKEVQVMVSLSGNSVVASLSPSRDVDKLMPKLLGFEKPSKSIQQSNQYQDTLSKYSYIGNSVYWINIRQLADYFVNPAQYDSAMLDILKVEDKMFSADCKTEMLAIFDKFPRLVGGTTVLEEHQLDSHMIIEMAEGLGSKFSALSGRIPSTNVGAAMSYGFSFDIAAAKNLAMEFVTNIETTPYKCELLQDMNAQASMFKEQLAQPLPPFVGNFKGVNVVVDELDLDLSKKDPNEMIKSLKAKVLLAVDNPEALKGMAEMMMPDIQKLGIKVGADAVNVSSLIPVSGSQMPINLDHIFLAMGSETIGLSLGEGTETELTSVVADESTTDLLSFSINADLYKDIFAGIEEFSGTFSEDIKKQMSMQKAMMVDMLWWNNESGSLDFTDRGFEIIVDISY